MDVIHVVLWWLAAVAILTLLSVRLLLEHKLRRRFHLPRARAQLPPLTVIRPVKGLDVGARENVDALLNVDYPGDLEVLFVFDSEADPAYRLVAERISHHPRGVRARLLTSGPPRPGVTGKLNAMEVGVARARGELVAFSDSDTRPGKALLAPLVTLLLEDARNGAAFTTLTAAAERPSSGDVGYELLVNAWYGGNVAAARDEDGTISFLMGQLMVFRREALEAIGGVGVAQGQFVDDMYLGKKLKERGFRNVILSAPLSIVAGELDLKGFTRLFRRWYLFSKSGLVFRDTWPSWFRGMASWIAWASGVGAVATGARSALAIAALGVSASLWDQVTLQRRLGGPRVALRHLWVPALLPLVLGVLALTTYASSSIHWRGRRYALNEDARLGEDGRVVDAKVPDGLG
jgi:ceramide glucosyltransferase